MDFAERFWSKVDKTTGCWSWTGARRPTGYGLVKLDGRLETAHRVAWMLTKGPIPDGQLVCHTCDNPPCCNPLHLFLGTPKENYADSRKKGRARPFGHNPTHRGHIKAHGDGAWRLYANGGTDPVTGRRHQITKVVRGTRKEAERALTRLLAEVDGGAHPAGDAVTFGQVLDAWLAHKAISVEPTTLDTYRASAAYVTDHLRALPVRKVTVTHLEQLYAHLVVAGRKNRRTGQSEGLGRAAVGNVHAAIHNALELARRRSWITVNPAADAERPAGQRRIPTPAEARALPALLAAAEKIDPLRLPTFIRASVCAGTRRSEMHGLRWSGVNFDRSTVTIRDVIVRAGNQWLVKPRTKTGEARTIILDPGTMDLLRRVYDQAFELAASCGIVLPMAAFVFTDDPDGAMPWKPATTARRFSRCAATAGLPPATRIHDLRALCGTHLADSGVPIPVIGARLGHTLNSTTADIYVGRIPESDRLAAEVMGRLFDGPEDFVK